MINDASLVMIPSGYKDGKLYSVKPTDGSGDFTFSRGSNLAATRVNSEGLIEKGRENLLLQSNQFDTTWFNSNTTETGGQSDKDGGNDAWLLSVVAAGGRITQNISQSGVQTFSVYAKAGTYDFLDVLALGSVGRAAYFDLANGSVGITYDVLDANIEDVGNGWYRCSITFNDTISNVRLYPAIADNDLTGTSGNIYIQDAQLEQGLVATDYIETTTTTAQAGILEDMPRLNYGTCPSLLLEPQRTNLLTHSEYFGGYSVNNGTATANEIISPEGILNGYKFTENTGTSAHYIDTTSISVTSGNDYVISVFGKYDGRFLTIQGSSSIISSNYATFNLETGVVEQENIGDASIEDYGNGWYRCIFKITATGTGSGAITILLNDSATGGRSRNYTGDGTSGIYLYGFQVEAGSYPTSYIPTYGASVTRGADSCYKTGVSSLIGQTEGTIYAEIEAQLITSSNQDITLSDGTANNRIVMRLNTSSLINAIGVFGGSVEFNMGTTPYTTGSTYKIALAYKVNDAVLYINGTQAATDTSVSISGTFSRFGFDANTSGTQNLYSKLKQSLLFKTRLSNDELAALTS